MAILAVLIFGVCLLLFICKTTNGQRVVNAVKPCDEAVDGVVLDKMWPQFHAIPNHLDVWLSHNYEAEYWNPQFDRWQKELTHCRTWAEKLEDRCLRSAYLHWLDYYERELDSARKELRTKAEKKEMDEYDARNERERQAREKYDREHKVPSCPKCP